MRRLWWLFGFFCLGALIDLVGTIWNLSFLGYGFEGNPLISNWWSAVLLKLVVVGLLGWGLHYRFGKEKLWAQYSFVALLLITGFVQLFFGLYHLYFLHGYSNADELIVSERGDVLVMQNGIKINEFNPIGESQKLKYYAVIIGFFILYPYLLGLLSFRLLWWVLGKKA